LVGLRNRLIHGYDSIVHSQIYQSVKDLLPELERKVDEQLNVLSNREKTGGKEGRTPAMPQGG